MLEERVNTNKSLAKDVKGTFKKNTTTEWRVENKFNEIVVVSGYVRK